MKKSLALFVVAMMSVLTACGGEMESENRGADMPVAEEQRETGNKVAVEKEIPATGIGDTIEFGKYEQDNNDANGKEPIRWKVLAEDNVKMLIISEKGLDSKPYNEEYIQVTWETCTLRAWLNEEFYDEAFSDDEKQQIKKVTLTNDGDNDTDDKVFLLSLSEVEEYFSSNEDRICKTTDYAMKNSTDYRNKGTLPCSWWLRTPGGGVRKVAMVLNDGNVDRYGGDVYRDWITTYMGPGDIVRPAMWVKK